MNEYRWGTVTAAASATAPDVRLDGDTNSWATANGIPGYTPAVNQRVRVLIVDGVRVQIAALKR